MRRKTQSGFTLVELLVVVFVIGIVASIALLSIANVGDTRVLRNEGLRFATLVELSQDEAAMQGREFGIEVLTAGYRFVEYDPLAGLWTDIPGDDTLRLRAMPDDVELELYLEEKRIVLDDDPAPFDEPDKSNRNATDKSYAPHLFVFSSGDSTPFELHIFRDYDNQRVVVRGDALGAMEVINDSEN